MLTKVLMGLSAAALLALFIVSKLLMSSQEARGALRAEVSEAVSANVAQTENIELLEQDMIDLQERFEAEQRRAEAFTEAVAIGQVELEKSKREHASELAEVRDSLTVEDRVCADQRVPAAYFVRERSGSGDADGVQGSTSTDPD